MKTVIALVMLLMLAGARLSAQTECTPLRATWTATADNAGHAPEAGEIGQPPDPAENTAGPGELFIVKHVSATTDAGGPLFVYFEAKQQGENVARVVGLLVRGDVNNVSWTPSPAFVLESGERIAVVGGGRLRLDVFGWRVPTACRGRFLGLLP
jgi:hypothetical protein